MFSFTYKCLKFLKNICKNVLTFYLHVVLYYRRGGRDGESPGERGGSSVEKYFEMLMAATSRKEVDKIMRKVTDDMSLDLGEYMVLTSLAKERYSIL